MAATLSLPHLAGRAEALEPLGWTGREAAWIALVCLHSGVFVRSQFCHHHQCSPATAMRFIRRLVGDGVATEHPLPERRTPKRFYHIPARPLYRALDIEDVRHRRRPCGGVLWRRLLSLDAVLERPALPWLPTEQDKVHYFQSLQIPPRLLPRRVYRGKAGVTTRHFAFKLPIAGDGAVATFAYVDPGLATTRQLSRWCREHEPLWTSLRSEGVQVHVVALARTLAAEQRADAFLTRRLAPCPIVPLSAIETTTLHRIEAALLANDQAELRRWGGFMEAAHLAAPLRNRANAVSRTGGSLDHYQTHLAARVVDDLYAA